jgi:RNA polymerase sigma-70 factor, ECF subfamily
MARSQRTVGDAGLPDQHISQFAAQLIRRKARELASFPGFCPTDRDEIEQELRLVLLRRLDRFNPSLAHYNAFVTTVIERYSATILQHRRAESRTYRRCGSSLNQLVDDGDGNQIELGAVLPECQPGLRTRTHFRSSEELQDLASDVAQLLAELPAELADICERLKRESISTVARDLGIPRSTLRDLLKGVRARFDSCGMRGYL